MAENRSSILMVIYGVYGDVYTAVHWSKTHLAFRIAPLGVLSLKIVYFFCSRLKM